MTSRLQATKAAPVLFRQRPSWICSILVLSLGCGSDSHRQLEKVERECIKTIEASGGDVRSFPLSTPADLRFEVGYMETDPTPKAMACVAQLPGEVAFYLQRPSIARSTVELLPGVSRLRILSLGTTHVDETSFRELCEISQLREFAVNSNVAGDAMLADVGRLKQLRNLDLGRTNAGSKTAMAIENLVQLRDLNLSRSRVTDDDVARLSKLSKLQSLELGRTRISDKSLVNIARLTELKELLLNDTLITDDGMKYISQLSRLEILYIRNTRITAEGLKPLKALQNLQHIDAYGSRVDRALAAEVLPNVNVYCEKGKNERE